MGGGRGQSVQAGTSGAQGRVYAITPQAGPRNRLAYPRLQQLVFLLLQHETKDTRYASRDR